MNEIFFSMLFISIFMRYFNSRDLQIFRRPIVGLNIAGHGVLNEYSAGSDFISSLNRDLFKGESNEKPDEKKPDDESPKRYNSSYGNKFEYVKYIVDEKIIDVVIDKKRYMDPKFSLIDCANEVGYNRSYVSRAINENYNKNFSTMINDRRYELLCKVVKESPYMTREEYALRCGFNSITTMIRVIKRKTGLCYKEWKKKEMW